MSGWTVYGGFHEKPPSKDRKAYMAVLAPVPGGGSLRSDGTGAGAESPCGVTPLTTIALNQAWRPSAEKSTPGSLAT